MVISLGGLRRLRKCCVPCRLTATRSGWDRLAAKLVLNTVSTATMGKFGRLVSNWMANVDTRTRSWWTEERGWYRN